MGVGVRSHYLYSRANMSPPFSKNNNPRKRFDYYHSLYFVKEVPAF